MPFNIKENLLFCGVFSCDCLCSKFVFLFNSQIHSSYFVLGQKNAEFAKVFDIQFPRKLSKFAGGLAPRDSAETSYQAPSSKQKEN